MTEQWTSGLPHPLPEALGDVIAHRFHALGEPMRIRLLDQLRDGEATVHEIAERAGASQQNVSKHLGVLREAGILARRKDGTQVFYRVVDDGVFELCESVCGSVHRGVAELLQSWKEWEDEWSAAPARALRDGGPGRRRPGPPDPATDPPSAAS
jgi:ArsR family transcriptional regulator